MIGCAAPKQFSSWTRLDLSVAPSSHTLQPLHRENLCIFSWSPPHSRASFKLSPVQYSGSPYNNANWKLVELKVSKGLDLALYVIIQIIHYYLQVVAVAKARTLHGFDKWAIRVVESSGKCRAHLIFQVCIHRAWNLLQPTSIAWICNTRHEINRTLRLHAVPEQVAALFALGCRKSGILEECCKSWSIRTRSCCFHRLCSGKVWYISLFQSLLDLVHGSVFRKLKPLSSFGVQL